MVGRVTRDRAIELEVVLLVQRTRGSGSKIASRLLIGTVHQPSKYPAHPFQILETALPILSPNGVISLELEEQAAEV